MKDMSLWTVNVPRLVACFKSCYVSFSLILYLAQFQFWRVKLYNNSTFLWIKKKKQHQNTEI